MKNEQAYMDKGVFVLSLDTELAWGVLDDPGLLENNIKYYLQTRDVIDKIIGLTEKYTIPVTWAIVGHLFLESCDEVNGKKHEDIIRSQYPWYKQDWFHNDPCSNIKQDPLWYGKDIVEKIMACPIEHEIASHSFSHIIFGSKYTKRETVISDLKNCIKQGDIHGLDIKSFVFPRNSVGFLNELKDMGIAAYRGVEPSWYKSFPKKLKKVCHIFDQFFALKPPVVSPSINNEIINIPASMLYMSMDGFRKYIPMKSRISKARKGINEAVKNKGIFHLWFHPFNIASNPDKLLEGLEVIFKEASQQVKMGGLEVKTMGQIASEHISRGDRHYISYT